jgi:DNA-directed RNA polymerase I, II, and III subunit RPABC3
MTSILFEDIFEVKAINKDGAHFDRVSRLDCMSENYEMELQLDINSEIYKVKNGQKFTIAIAHSLSLDGRTERPSEGEPSLLDKYDYVMYGKIFKIKEEKEEGSTMKISIFASFGGLLMLLKGDQRVLSVFEPDIRVYLLMRLIA